MINYNLICCFFAFSDPPEADFITKTRKIESTKITFDFFRVFPAAAGCSRD